MNKIIHFSLNNSETEITVSPEEKLIDVLRNRLGIMSVKCGCGRGECGACTVLVNDMTIRSCITLAVEMDGKSIITLEGYQKEGITDIQQAFIRNNAFQCGFCAPGFILNTAELLNNNPDPDEEEIREALAGNLCRCTGYINILTAVKEVVQERKGN